MWVYKFAKKETRLQSPKFFTFLKENHDLLKLWFEDMHEPLEQRISFVLRFLRFVTTFFILFIATFALIHPQDEYYNNECSKRYAPYLAYMYIGCNAMLGAQKHFSQM